MRLRLIYPRWPKLRHQPEFHLPPHGPVVFAASLPPDVTVEFYDDHVQEVNFDDACDLVAISCMLTCQMPRGWEIADRFRAQGKPVIFGGIGVMLHAAETAAHADSVFLGEAEAGMIQVVADFRAGRLAPRYDHFHDFPDTALIGPARRDLLARERYNFRGVQMVDLVHASRGCRFNCFPCCTPFLGGRQFRPRPLAQVVAEVAGIPNSRLFFVDNSLAQDDQWEKDLFRALIPLRKKWISHPIKDDAEILDLAAAAGCWYVYQAITKRSATMAARIRRLKERGIGVEGTIILGTDDQDEDEIKRFVDYLMALDLDLAEFTILTPFPHTPIRAQLEREGRILHDDWRRYTADETVFRPARISPERLDAMFHYAWESFYADVSIELRMAQLYMQVIEKEKADGTYQRIRLNRRQWQSEAPAGLDIMLVSANTTAMPYPVYPLGLATIAAALERHGHRVTVFDLLHEDEAAARLPERLREMRPGLVGIAVRNLDNANMVNQQQYTAAVSEVVRWIRQASTAPIVLGGAGFSLAPESLMRHSGADYGIVGEGERLAVELAAAVVAGDPPPRGVILRNCGPAIAGAAIAAARYDAGLVGAYLRAGSVIPLQSKRGCPHDCVYCSYPALEGKILRPRHPVAVVDDMERLADEHHAPMLFFTDSVFNDDQGHCRALLAEMHRRQRRIPWSAFFKPSGLDADLVALMRDTGLVSAEMGSDGACDATLRGLRKPFRYNDIVRANDLFMQAGVAVAHYFIFGGPGETAATVHEGIGHIRDLACSAAFVSLGLRILPMTRLHQLAVAEGVLAPDADLLAPVYYCAPELDRQWIETTLAQAFAGLRHVIYPPDAMDDKLQLLHKLGYAGAPWPLLARDHSSG